MQVRKENNGLIFVSFESEALAGWRQLAGNWEARKRSGWKEIWESFK